MNPEEFIELLNEARELMIQEEFVKAGQILEKLKDTDKKSEYEYNYSLIHQLYQLDSNCKSAYNQQRILEVIKGIPITKSSIPFEEINRLLRDKENLTIKDEILRREVEILILRNLLHGKIEGNQLIFVNR
ncbi:MAG: hypothetical protein ACFFD7_09375 [Candidatus Thorarchaeota archaeon]